MRFEDLDKKLREAADQHHPAYDEKAWQKMEKLLNVHLPKPTNDKRRIFLFLAAFLFIGGGAYLLVSSPWETETKIAVHQQDKNENASQASGEQRDKEALTTEQNQIKSKSEVKTANFNSTAESVKEKNISKAGSKDLITTTLKKVVTKEHHIDAKQGEKANTELSKPFDKSRDQDNLQVHAEKMITGQASNEVVSQPNPNEAKVIREEVKQTNETKTADIVNSKTSTPKKNEKVTNRNGFSFSVSAGPDVSKAGGSKAGEATLTYGAGVGYTRNRVTLRTGVYAAKKLYWADAKDYSLSYVPPSTSRFTGADADCYVIEVPIKVSYNFGLKSTSNWFAGAGLSSYFMKRETYNYIYKTSSGNTYSHTLEVNGENKHYFSILNLSAGYTHRLGNIFSISAEPYLEYPLTGIGEGKVNLKSAGVLFTLGVKPFKK